LPKLRAAESTVPLFNPYFQLKDGVCTGMWNDDIVELLPNIRPGVDYIEKQELFTNSGGMVGKKPLSMKASSYAPYADKTLMGLPTTP
jgi:hypothetical protein